MLGADINARRRAVGPKRAMRCRARRLGRSARTALLAGVLGWSAFGCNQPDVEIDADDEGRVSLSLAVADEVVELDDLAIRLRIDDRWISSAQLGEPRVSRSDDGLEVRYTTVDSTEPREVKLAFQRDRERPSAVRLDVTITSRGNARLQSFELATKAGGLKLPQLGSSMLYLHHGYQSWSFTGPVTLDTDDAQPALTAEAFAAREGNPALERERISWWWGGYAAQPTAPVLVAGALDASHFRTALAIALRQAGGATLTVRVGVDPRGVPLAAGEQTALEPLIFTAADSLPAALERYAAGVAGEMKPLSTKGVPPPGGWWSWSAFFDRVDEADVLSNARAARDRLVPLGLKRVLLDDGYASWGDWEKVDATRFPSGLGGLAKKLVGLGLQPGLWLAPFLVHDQSSLVKQHPSWFVRDTDGKLLRHVMLGIPAAMHVLDPTHPQAANHLTQLFSRLRSFGFSLFKLDFLYAGALSGKRHDDVSGIAALRLGLSVIARAAKGAHINLCGMPILPAVGRGHSLRVGADIAFKGTPPSITGMVHEARNVMLRSFLDPLIRTDPDQVLVRAPLSVDEARTAATLAALTGFYTSGDDLTKLPAERRAILTNATLLRIAKLAHTGRVVDPWSGARDRLFPTPMLDLGPFTPAPTRFLLRAGDDERFFALFNFSSKTRAMPVSPAVSSSDGWRAQELWTKRSLQLDAQARVKVVRHGVALIRLWRADGEKR